MQEQLAEQVNETYSRLFSSAEGVLVLAHMMAIYRVFEPLGESLRPLDLARRNAQREVVLDILRRSGKADAIIKNLGGTYGS